MQLDQMVIRIQTFKLFKERPEAVLIPVNNNTTLTHFCYSRNHKEIMLVKSNVFPVEIWHLVFSLATGRWWLYWSIISANFREISAPVKYQSIAITHWSQTTVFSKFFLQAASFSNLKEDRISFCSSPLSLLGCKSNRKNNSSSSCLSWQISNFYRKIMSYGDSEPVVQTRSGVTVGRGPLTWYPNEFLNTLPPSHQWRQKTRLWHCCRKQTCPEIDNILLCLMTCTNTVPCKKVCKRLVRGRDFPLSLTFKLLLPSVDIQCGDKSWTRCHSVVRVGPRKGLQFTLSLSKPFISRWLETNMDNSHSYQIVHD